MDLISSLHAQLENGFQKKRFQDAMAALKEENNPFRVQSFFSIFRELAGSVIDRLVPVEEIRACSWFMKSHAPRNPVMDDDRASFLIHGGISPSDAELELFLAVDVAHTALSEAFNKLRSFMTVSNATDKSILLGGNQRANEALAALFNLLMEADKASGALAEAFDNQLGDAMNTINGNAISAEDNVEVYRSKGNDGLHFIEVSHTGATAIELITYSRINVIVKEDNGNLRRRISFLPKSGSVSVTHKFEVKTDNLYALRAVENSLSIASIN